MTKFLVVLGFAAAVLVFVARLANEFKESRNRAALTKWIAGFEQFSQGQFSANFANMVFMRTVDGMLSDIWHLHRTDDGQWKISPTGSEVKWSLIDPAMAEEAALEASWKKFLAAREKLGEPIVTDPY